MKAAALFLILLFCSTGFASREDYEACSQSEAQHRKSTCQSYSDEAYENCEIFYANRKFMKCEKILSGSSPDTTGWATANYPFPGPNEEFFPGWPSGKPSVQKSSEAPGPSRRENVSAAKVKNDPTPAKSAVMVLPDIRACLNRSATAHSCCGDPESCLPVGQQLELANFKTALNEKPAPSAGISGVCEKMRSTAKASERANAMLEATCDSNRTLCVDSCSSLLDTFRQLRASCENCEQEAEIQNAIEQLTAKQSYCSGLAARVGTIGLQSAYDGKAANESEACLQAARMESTGETSAAAGAKPQSSGALQVAEAVAQGISSFFAVGAKESFGSDRGQKAAAISKREPISEESQDAPPMRASPQGDPGKVVLPEISPARIGDKAPPPPAGVSTDIERGFRSVAGSYASGPLPIREDGKSETPDGRRSGVQSSSVDLRNYLPGGRLNHHMAANQIQHANHIYGPHVDIWQRVSIRIREKCNRGGLFNCR